MLFTSINPLFLLQSTKTGEQKNKNKKKKQPETRVTPRDAAKRDGILIGNQHISKPV